MFFFFLFLNNSQTFGIYFMIVLNIWWKKVIFPLILFTLKILGSLFSISSFKKTWLWSGTTPTSTAPMWMVVAQCYILQLLLRYVFWLHLSQTASWLAMKKGAIKRLLQAPKPELNSTQLQQLLEREGENEEKNDGKKILCNLPHIKLGNMTFYAWSIENTWLLYLKKYIYGMAIVYS